jgi:Na+/proline symporter
MVVQQVLTCKSVANGRKALILSAAIIFPVFLVFLLTGVLLWAYDAQFDLQQFIPKNTAGLKQNDYIYPLFILKSVPPWLKGFLIVAILSAAMSSVSSALAALSSVSTMDILKGLARKERGEQYFFRVSRASTVFWCGMLVLVAFLSRQATFVYNLAFTLNGLTSGAILGGVLLAVFARRGGSLPVIAGMVVSLLCMVGVSRIEWTVEIGGRSETMQVFWPWYTLIGTSVTLVVTWAVRTFVGEQPEGPVAPA